MLFGRIAITLPPKSIVFSASTSVLRLGSPLNSYGHASSKSGITWSVGACAAFWFIFSVCAGYVSSVRGMTNRLSF